MYSGIPTDRSVCPTRASGCPTTRLGRRSAVWDAAGRPGGVAPGREGIACGAMTAPGPRETVLLVDGENIDATLGGSLLGRRPAPEERPRWDRVLDHARDVWAQDARGLFFL